MSDHKLSPNPPAQDHELEPLPESILTLTADSFLPRLDQPQKLERTLAPARTLELERERD